MKEIILKSCAASLCLALAIPALLKEPVYGSILFSLGLFTIVSLKLKLFTGVAGFVIEDRVSPVTVLAILTFNVVAGYLLGLLFSVMDSSLVPLALAKVATWELSFSYFVKAFMCGVIMYIAVKLSREGTSLGIFFGVPLFLFSGFQHSIANSIIMGVSCSFDPALLLAVFGNFVGSISFWLISRDSRVLKIKL